MSQVHAASVTYHRQKPIRGRAILCVCSKPVPKPLENGRKPFRLPEPTNPDGDIEKMSAEIRTLYPDSPLLTLTDKEYEDLFQRHTNRKLFRDS